MPNKTIWKSRHICVCWGPIPKVQGTDPAAGCSGSVLGTGAALAAHPILPPGIPSPSGMENRPRAALGATAEAVAAMASYPGAQGIRKAH